MSILKKPLVTEKMTTLGESKKQYGFVVEKTATKGQIKAAIQELYEVEVKAVRTMILPGKVRNRGTRSGYITGKTPAFKKAIVTLAPGQEIDFYKNI